MIVAAVGALSANIALAEPRYDFSIPAGRLDSSIILIGTQGAVSIGISDGALAHLPAPDLHGRYTVPEALRRLTSHLPAIVRRIDDRSFQILRADPPKISVVPKPSEDLPEITVKGSKRASALADYAGSVQSVGGSEFEPAQRHLGSEALVERLPFLASTHLGPGRDKLFIRGIADSSFIGPTQATVGQYLGDLRINYNAPDPSLALYDIRSVEVLEGPQGTLYGAGSLGGIIRLEPEPPSSSRRAFAVSAGGSMTAHGAGGGDLSGVANLPLGSLPATLRLVGYASIDGGYIDDPARGQRNVNRTFTRGGRGTLRTEIGGWTIDLVGVLQDINSRDGQYIDRSLPGLQRATVIAQPFDNDYSLGGLTVHRHFAGLDLVSATSVIAHDLHTTYDASSGATARIYSARDTISILSNETRLSHANTGGFSWVGGVELLKSIDRSTRSLGPPAAAAPSTGTRNLVQQASIYGEVTQPVFHALAITAGARASYTHLVGRAIDAPAGSEGSQRHQPSFLPSVALLWKIGRKLSVYARYEEGYRPGGLSAQSGIVQRFEADSLASSEIGARFGNDGDRFSASAAISYAHWEDIQADLVDITGLPFTDNIGSGRVIGIEAKARWRLLRAFTIEGSVFAESSRLSAPQPAYAGEKNASLPNVPNVAGRVEARYTNQWSGHPVHAYASLQYVGHSRLGVGTTFDLQQGDYWNTRTGVSLGVGPTTLSIDADNLLDGHRNTFALGNPFGVTMGNQATPQRPRNIRFGVAAHF